jgi:hypothetical protein
VFLNRTFVVIAVSQVIKVFIGRSRNYVQTKLLKGFEMHYRTSAILIFF